MPIKKGPESPFWKGCGEISAKYWFNVTNHADQRQLEMNVSIEDAWALFEHQECRCALTGVKLQFGTNGNQTASLDRIDSNKGYSLENIQWIHKDINFMKRRMSNQELVLWCMKIVAHANEPRG